MGTDQSTLTPSRRRAYAAFAVVAVCVAIYGRGLNGPFIFDDKTAIEASPHIQTLWPPTRSLSAPDESAAAGRPVLCLTLALNHAVHGLDVRGYHLVNLALHIGTALLLMAIIAHTLRRLDRAENADTIAAIAALLWAVHPLHTESVQYVVQRSELLFAFFLLAMLYAFIRGRRALAVICCVLGMASKEAMAVAPLLMLLYDRAFVSGSFGEAWRRGRAMYLGLASSWLLLAWLIAQGPRDQSVGPREGITVVNYLLTQAGVLVHYLRLTVWPAPLVIVYDWPIVQRVGDWFLPGLAVVSLLGVTGWGVWRNRWYGFVGAWCFCILAPTSSFVPMTYEIVAERRMYAPLMALMAMSVAAVAGWRGVASWRGSPAVAVALVLVLAGLSWHRVGDYRSELSIWSDAAVKQPGSHLGQHNLGLALQRAGNLGDAIQHYEAALALKPNYRPSWLNMGNCLLLQLRFDEAMRTYQTLLEIDPRYPPAHNNLGLLLARSGRRDEAIRHFAAAVESEPRYVDARINLAVLLIERGRHDEARRELDAVLHWIPDHSHASDLRQSIVQVAEVTTQ